MTDTERIANEVYDRYTALHECAVLGCHNLCAGSRYCERCFEEITANAYNPLAQRRQIPWITILCVLGLIAWVIAAIKGNW